MNSTMAWSCVAGPGTAYVRRRVEVIAIPDGVTSPGYAVQAGAFQHRATAERIRAEMATR